MAHDHPELVRGTSLRSHPGSPKNHSRDTKAALTRSRGRFLLPWYIDITICVLGLATSFEAGLLPLHLEHLPFSISESFTFSSELHICYLLEVYLKRMGSITSKAAKGASKRQYPTSIPSRRAPASESSPSKPTGVGPTVHPKPQASTARDQGIIFLL